MKKRIISFVIAAILIITSSLPVNGAIMPSIEYQLTNIAIEYIEKYIQNIYLYQSNDLSQNTLKEKIGISEWLRAEDYSKEVQTLLYELDGRSVSAATLCEEISSFEAVSDYIKHIRETQNIVRYDFSATVVPADAETSEKYASVYLHSLVTFRYSPEAELSTCGDYYKISFVNIEKTWYIAEILAEEHIQYGLTDFVEEYDDRIAEFDNRLKKCNYSAPQLEYPEVPRSAFDRSYSPANTVAYAYTYTTSTYTGDYNNPTFLNNSFHDCTDDGGNCQNFASQCVWAGFNGNSLYNEIHNHSFPMDSEIDTTAPHPEETIWYGSADNGNSGPWVATDDFYDYITSSDSQIIAVTGTVNGSFAYIPLYMLKGAVLHVNPNANGYAHAVVITNATGTSYSSIEICENSPMRKAVLLSDQAFLSQMRLIMPTAMKNGRSCTNGTHSFSGNHCKCSYCGFNKLTVKGSILKPIPVNSTQTITAIANSTCYRMAVCIKYDSPNATEYWTEYMNTNQLSKTFTFSNTGLYTITVVARDVSPNDANSVTSTHVFKIRVY